MRILFCYLLFFTSFFVLKVEAQIVPISDVQGESASSSLIGQTVELKGEVTGVYSAGYFIRDGLGAWQSVYVYDSRSPMPEKGDTVKITGLVDEYYDFTEIKSVSAFEIISDGNPAPVPTVITVDEIGELWESCYVKIEDAVCTNTDLGYGEWELDDESGKVVVDDFGVQFTPELGQNYTIVAPLYYSFGAFKLVPASIDDIIINAPLYFTKDLIPSEIEHESLTFTWETNIPASSKLFYGETKDLELGEVASPENTLTHGLSIVGFDPGQFYFVQAYSAFGGDEAISPMQMFSTRSESSGEVKVWFNDIDEYDTIPSVTASLLDTVIRYIDSARTSIDIAMYDLDNHSSVSDNRNYQLIEALNAASFRGVQVRFITDDEPENVILDDLVEAITVLKGNADGIMHNKFLIIDAEEVMSSWLITGSTNLNFNNLAIDYNNVIAIQDQAIAKAYRIEFEEMWGSTSLSPDEGKSKFGANKEDNTPHYFNVSGDAFELWFSPSDNTAKHINDVLDSAKSTVDFAIMAFTEDMLGNTLKELSSNAINVNGVIDYVEYSGSEFAKLDASAVSVVDYRNTDGLGWPENSTVHHKYAVVDAGLDNAKVITGSHNWTASANSKHDENTIVVGNTEVSQLYKEELARILKKTLTPVCVNDTIYAVGCEETTFSVIGNDYIYDDSFQLYFDDEWGDVLVGDDNTCTWIPPCACVKKSIYGFELKYYIQHDKDESYLDSAILIAYVDIGAVEGNSLDDMFKVYPNPVNDILHISTSYGANFDAVTLYNQLGKEVLSKEYSFESEAFLNVSGLNAGMYFMKICSEQGSVVKKIIIKD